MKLWEDARISERDTPVKAKVEEIGPSASRAFGGKLSMVSSAKLGRTRRRETFPDIVRRVPLCALRPLLKTTQVSAAKALGISPTTLKKLCRHYGIARWPFRQMAGLDRAFSRIEPCLRGAPAEELLDSAAEHALMLQIRRDNTLEPFEDQESDRSQINRGGNLVDSTHGEDMAESLVKRSCSTPSPPIENSPSSAYQQIGRIPTTPVRHEPAGGTSPATVAMSASGEYSRGLPGDAFMGSSTIAVATASSAPRLVPSHSPPSSNWVAAPSLYLPPMRTSWLGVSHPDGGSPAMTAEEDPLLFSARGEYAPFSAAYGDGSDQRETGAWDTSSGRRPPSGWCSGSGWAYGHSPSHVPNSARFDPLRGGGADMGGFAAGGGGEGSCARGVTTDFSVQDLELQLLTEESGARSGSQAMAGSAAATNFFSNPSGRAYVGRGFGAGNNALFESL